MCLKGRWRWKFLGTKRPRSIWCVILCNKRPTKRWWKINVHCVTLHWNRWCLIDAMMLSLTFFVDEMLSLTCPVPIASTVSRASTNHLVISIIHSLASRHLSAPRSASYSSSVITRQRWRKSPICSDTGEHCDRTDELNDLIKCNNYHLNASVALA